MADQVKIPRENFMRAEACMDRSSDDERHERLKDMLLEAANTITEMRRYLESAAETMRNSNIQSGVCCCGDNMENHPEPMGGGHSPVDSGDWHAHLWLQAVQEKFGVR